MKNGQNFAAQFNRSEKAHQDLHSGLTSKNENESNANILEMMKSVVAYLGTINIGQIGFNLIPKHSFTAVQQCVDALRLEQHIHQRVVMSVSIL